MDYKSKGATYLDKLCHKLYDEPKGNGIKVSGECHRCGGPLSAYYCEERLYLIACEECGTVVLTKACSPQIAANLTIVEKDANAQNLRVSKIIARAEAAEKRVEELEKSLSEAAQVVKTIQESTITFYERRAEKAERELKAYKEMIYKERPCFFCAKYTDSWNPDRIRCDRSTKEYRPDFKLREMKEE